MRQALTFLSLATLFAAPMVSGQDRPCDRSKIEWVLPGQFERARQRAVDEQRMLLIKGISFGVDDAGATCATAGTW